MESCRARGGGNSGGKSMKASQFLFKTLYLWALGQLTGRKDILKPVHLHFVHGRAGMRNNLSFFHQLVTQICPYISTFHPVGAAFQPRFQTGPIWASASQVLPRLDVDEQPEWRKSFGELGPPLYSSKSGTGLSEFYNVHVLDIGFHNLRGMSFQNFELLFKSI